MINDAKRAAILPLFEADNIISTPDQVPVNTQKFALSTVAYHGMVLFACDQMNLMEKLSNEESER